MSAGSLSPSPFYPGEPCIPNLPLARYLPPYRPHTFTSWVTDKFPDTEPSISQPILDPFGNSPLLCVEIASRGYPLIVCSNNPINRILIEFLASSPTQAEMSSLIAEISSIRKMDQRLETFLRSLYQSYCNQCKSDVEVENFIWEKTPQYDEPVLVGKKYTCPSCGATGEFPIISEDVDRLKTIPPANILNSQALTRVIDPDDEDKDAIVEAVNTYRPRTIFALFNLINKIENLSLPKRKLLFLHTLLISLFDVSNALFSPSTKKTRPKQLGIPSRFFETNIWLLLENLSKDLSSIPLFSSQIKVVYPPALPAGGEICIFEGRLRDFFDRFSQVDYLAIVGCLPRPNQAYWTFSALWTGWLFGKEAVKPLRSVLHRRRYDWGWHTRALSSIFREVQNHAQFQKSFFGLMDEYEPNFLSAALFAADNENCLLKNITLRDIDRRAQIEWDICPSSSYQELTNQPNIKDPIAIFNQSWAQAISTIIKEHKEPISYLLLHTIALSSSVVSASTTSPHLSFTKQFDFDSINDLPNFFNRHLSEFLTSNPDIYTLNSNEKNVDGKLWWCRSATFPSTSQLSLVDRIEISIAQTLREQEQAIHTDIDQWMCKQFPGFNTPSSEYIEICLSSYALLLNNQNPVWKLRPEDSIDNRDKDISEMMEIINSLGSRMGYHSTTEGQEINWLDEQDRIVAHWIVRSNAVLSDLLSRKQSHTTISYLVVPGGRINLILYKIQNNPIYQNIFQHDWQIIRFRQLRWMNLQPNINLQSFHNWLSYDPLNFENPQLRLI